MAYSVEQFKSVVSSEGGLARANLYSVVLPTLPGTFANSGSINLLTKSVQLPPRQINTVERNINGYRTKVGNGSITDDISMTFTVTNSMMVKEYFETWMKLIWDPETRRAGYFRDYAKQIQIKALSLPKYNADFRLPSGLQNLPFRNAIPDVNLGPVNLSLATGGLSLDFGQNTIQSVTLENAFPFTMNPVELGDENNAFVDLTISFTYSEWYGQKGLGGSLAGLLQL